MLDRHGSESEASDGDRSGPQEGPWRRAGVRHHLGQGPISAKNLIFFFFYFFGCVDRSLLACLGLWYGQCEPQGEVRRGSQEGDQEAAEVSRSDQDVATIERDKGQEGVVF